MEQSPLASRVSAIQWRNGILRLLDQRRLPDEERYLEIESARGVAEAIRHMVVRGAPAIGIAAAYGVVLAARHRMQQDRGSWKERIEADFRLLADARPTAVNLAWALRRMRAAVDAAEGDVLNRLQAEARAIHREDMEANMALAEAGAALIAPGSRVLTHCNTGALATGGYGTALGVIRTAWAQERLEAVYATETRPWLQGARLTAWELDRDGIPATLIVDSAAGRVMARPGIDWVIVGADRIAANGDVANKIGTYGLAVLARAHGARVMVAAPSSTLDPDIATGDGIEIENRDPGEVWGISGDGAPPEGISVENPAFDVTPADWIDAIVTENGVVESPGKAGLSALLAKVSRTVA